MLRPPKYDGTTSFETFLAQFNCSQYNAWDEGEQLAHLRGTLETEAAQVLIRILVQRSSLPFTSLLGLYRRGSDGSVKRTNRMEVKRRRRKADEPLRTLHSDIRSLTAMGPRLVQCGLGRGLLPYQLKRRLHPASHLATIDMGENWVGWV